MKRLIAILITVLILAVLGLCYVCKVSADWWETPPPPPDATNTDVWPFKEPTLDKFLQKNLDAGPSIKEVVGETFDPIPVPEWVWDCPL